MRLLRPIPLSAIVLLFASVVASWSFVRTTLDLSLFCSGGVRQGANLGHAEAIAFFTGIGASLLLAFVYPLRGAVVGVLFVAIAALGLAIAFVALDSATYVQLARPCGFSDGTGTATRHVSGIYYAWGIAIGLLVLQLARVLGLGFAITLLVLHPVRVLGAHKGPRKPPRGKSEQSS